MLRNSAAATVHAPPSGRNVASRSGRYLFELQGAPTGTGVVVRVSDTGGNAAASTDVPGGGTLAASAAPQRARTRP